MYGGKVQKNFCSLEIDYIYKKGRFVKDVYNIGLKPTSRGVEPTSDHSCAFTGTGVTRLHAKPYLESLWTFDVISYQNGEK